MGISRREAFETLELPFGADQDSVRTSYKRLSMKWHPEKHKSSPESIKNFLEISMGYKRLNIESDIVQMSVGDCLELFKNTFTPQSQGFSNGYNNDDDDDYDESEDDEDDYDEDLDDDLYSFLGNPEARQLEQLSPGEIEKNANELITEEEKERRKAEKRRAKKKRRREKKKLEKVTEQPKKANDSQKQNKKSANAERKPKKADKKNVKESGSEAEEFDQSAAFFTQVVNKKKKASNVPEPVVNNKPKPEPVRTSNGNEDSLEDLDPVVLRSRQLAIEGNKMANLGHYQAAIDLFTEAVKLDPRDFRFFGNRSYCFDRMQLFEKALKDADRAINLAPDWPKGYFRKGRALAGLKLYPEAEQAFMQVLKLDKNCEDAMQELTRVKIHQLTEMGFSQQQAQVAIKQYDTVHQALDSLLAGMGMSELSIVADNSMAAEVYVSDDEDYGGAASLPQSVSLHSPPISAANHVNPPSKHKEVKMNPTNPEGLTALWVGNVLPDVAEKKLLSMFSKFGLVTSVRLLPEKYCAFINFKTKEAAGAAMKGLQGAPCAGQQLLIKFPDNPISNGSLGLTGARKIGSTIKPNIKSPSVAVKPALKGPVNGNECYFWRTTGCQFGNDCHYRHLPEHKGIDKKPWQNGKS